MGKHKKRRPKRNGARKAGLDVLRIAQLVAAILAIARHIKGLLTE